MVLSGKGLPSDFAGLNIKLAVAAVGVIPYTLVISSASLMVVSLMNHYSPKTIASTAFITVAVGLIILSATISFDMGTPMVIFGLMMIVFTEGALIILLFNVLVSVVTKHMSGDFGAVSSVANNHATTMGTVLAGVITVRLLSTMVASSLMHSTVPNQIKQHINLDNNSFVSNDHLVSILNQTDATEAKVEKAVRINIDVRQCSMRAAFFILADMAVLAIVPSRGLPGYEDEQVIYETASPDSDQI